MTNTFNNELNQNSSCCRLKMDEEIRSIRPKAASTLEEEHQDSKKEWEGIETRISSAHNCENILNFENRSSVVRKEFNCLTNNMSNNMDFKNGSDGMILNFENESSVVREEFDCPTSNGSDNLNSVNETSCNILNFENVSSVVRREFICPTSNGCDNLN